MKQTLSLALLFAAGMAASCSNNGKIIEQLQQEKDSLLQVSGQQQDIIDGLASTMEEITQSIDTIASQEKVIVSGIDEMGVPLTKKNMRTRLQALSELIKEQHAKLDSLGAALDLSNSTMGKLRYVIRQLNESLEQKSKEIEDLQQELNIKNTDIATLNTKVASLNDTISSVRSENAAQKQTIAQQVASIGQQDAELHEVYYAIGTKEQLLQAGIIDRSGGLFKKKKVNFSGLSKANLKKADIRELKHLDIPYKNAKILGEVPQDSYSLTKTGNANSLNILNASKFWSANNRVLVVLVK